MAKTKRSASVALAGTPTAEFHPSREAIALRAYEIYLERGCEPGRELEDWTRAEQELSPKNGKARRRSSPKPIAA